jgi:flagellar basal-body rod protein FlgF
MDNALYVGLSRQMVLRREMDIIANNIANEKGIRPDIVDGARIEGGAPAPAAKPTTPPTGSNK